MPVHNPIDSSVVHEAQQVQHELELFPSNTYKTHIFISHDPISIKKVIQVYIQVDIKILR